MVKQTKSVNRMMWFFARAKNALLLSVCAVALQGCANSPVETEKSQQNTLSEFQWTIKTHASWFFIEQGEYLLPARAVDAQILESIPLKKRVRLLSNQQELVIPLAELLSPFAISSQSWTLQLQDEKKQWSTTSTFHFTDEGFVTSLRDIPIDVGEFASLRFVRNLE